MSLKQRCINTAVTVAVRAVTHYHHRFGPIYALAKKYGIKNLPGTGSHKPILLLVNFDWALEPPRPIGPAIKYLGALMPQDPQPLPPNLITWLTDHQGRGCMTHLFSSAIWIRQCTTSSTTSICHHLKHLPKDRILWSLLREKNLRFKHTTCADRAKFTCSRRTTRPTL